MWQAYDSGFQDRGVLVQHFLDLARIHVETAADDQVLLPIDDVEEAVAVLHSQIACVEPAVPDRVRGRVRALPVALHHIVPADGDLTDLAGRQVAAHAVYDPHPPPAIRIPDGSCFGVAEPVERGDRGRL